MGNEDVWADPRTWISIGSLCVGFTGLLYGVLSGTWNRRESRLDALSKILQPLVKAAQKMHAANECRRKCEQLRRSFPDTGNAQEAAAHVNALVGEYGEHMKFAQDEFRLAESELASRSFRFPDKVTALVQKVLASLSEFGRLVNGGLFDKADLQFAKFRDDYTQVTKEGRGWRLADPLEGIKRRFRRKKKEPVPSDKYDLSDNDMDAIMELVHKRATTQASNTFTIHPPKKLLDRPDIATSDKVIEELDDSIFVVAFQDGTTRMMSLVELMVFTYNLVILAVEHQQIAKMMAAAPPPGGEAVVSTSFQMRLDDVMRPETVKALLSKIKFSNDPSDGEEVKQSA